MLCFFWFTNDSISANAPFVVAAEQSMLRKTLICRTSFNSFLKHNGQYYEPQSVKSCLRFKDGRLFVIVVSNHFANVLLKVLPNRFAMESARHKLEHDNLCRHCFSHTTDCSRWNCDNSIRLSGSRIDATEARGRIMTAATSLYRTASHRHHAIRPTMLFSQA